MHKHCIQYFKICLSLVGPSETGKSQFFYNWPKNGTFGSKFDKISFFHQHSQTLYDVMQKLVENLDFVQGENFEFIDSLKNGTKYLLIFDDSCEEIRKSKAFVGIASAGRHRGLSSIYIKHNFFYQSKLGR